MHLFLLYLFLTILCRDDSPDHSSSDLEQQKKDPKPADRANVPRTALPVAPVAPRLPGGAAGPVKREVVRSVHKGRGQFAFNPNDPDQSDEDKHFETLPPTSTDPEHLRENYEHIRRRQQENLQLRKIRAANQSSSSSSDSEHDARKRKGKKEKKEKKEKREKKHKRKHRDKERKTESERK